MYIAPVDESIASVELEAQYAYQLIKISFKIHEELKEGYPDNIDMLKKVSPTFNEFLNKLLPFDLSDKENFAVKEI